MTRKVTQPPMAVPDPERPAEAPKTRRVTTRSGLTVNVPAGHRVVERKNPDGPGVRISVELIAGGGKKTFKGSRAAKKAARNARKGQR